jgi:hypothetical protein
LSQVPGFLDFELAFKLRLLKDWIFRTENNVKSG